MPQPHRPLSSEHDPSIRHAAEALFAHYQERLERGDQVDFEALCREHQELEGELRRIEADMAALAILREGLGLGSRLDTSPLDALDWAEGAREFLEAIGARLESASPRDWHYEVRREIGEGSFGLVLEVDDLLLRRRLAMKVLKGGSEGPGSTDDRARRLQRFMEEAQVLAQLDHPMIVPLVSMGVDPSGRPYFTMGLVSGQSFEEVVHLVRDRSEGWSIERCLRELARVAEALGHAHERGVVHRDVKPDNIRVSRGGKTCLVDWGLARVVGRVSGHRRQSKDGAESVHTDRRALAEEDPGSPLLTTDGTVVGTLAYMAPEQAEGRVDAVGPAADIYSLGAILYHLLTGRPPYHAPGERIAPEARLARVLTGPPVPVAELASAAPEELVAICEKAMERDPGSRYASALEMGGDLLRYLDGRVVRAFESGAWAELRKWVRRNRGVAASIAAAAALFVGLMATALVLQSRLASDSLARERDAKRRLYVADLATAARRAEIFAFGEVPYRRDDSLIFHLHSVPEELRGWEWDHLCLVAGAQAATLVTNQVSVTETTHASIALYETSGTGTVTVRGSEGPRTDQWTVPAEGRFAFAHVVREDEVWVLSEDGLLTTASVSQTTGEFDLGLETWSEAAILGDRGQVVVLGEDGILRSFVAPFEQPLWESEMPESAASLTADGGILTLLDGGAVVAVEADNGAVRRLALADSAAAATCASGGDAGAVWIGTSDGAVLRWDLTSNAVDPATEPHDGEVVSICAAGSAEVVVSAGVDHTLRVRSTIDGSVIRIHPSRQRPERIHVVPGSRELVVLQRELDLFSFPCTYFPLDRSYGIVPLPEALGVDGPITSDLSTGTVIAYDFDGPVAIDTTTGEQLGTFESSTLTFPVKVARSGDGRWLAVADEFGDFEVWDLQERRIEHSWSSERDSVPAVLAFDRSGQRLAYLDDSGVIEIVCPGTDRSDEVAATGATAIAFDPSDRLWVGFADGGLELSEGEGAGASMESVGAAVTSISFDSISDRVAVGTRRGTLTVLSTRTGKSLLPVLMQAGGILAAFFHPDEPRLFSFSSEEGWVWDGSTGERLAPFVIPRGPSPASGEVIDAILSVGATADRSVFVLHFRTRGALGGTEALAYRTSWTREDALRVAATSRMQWEGQELVLRARKALAARLDPPLFTRGMLEEEISVLAMDPEHAASAFRHLMVNPYSLRTRDVEKTLRGLQRTAAPNDPRVGAMVKLAERSTEELPMAARSWDLLGSCRMTQGRHSDAAHAWLRATDLSVFDELRWNRLVTACWHSGDAELARRALETIEPRRGKRVPDAAIAAGKATLRTLVDGQESPLSAAGQATEPPGVLNDLRVNAIRVGSSGGAEGVVHADDDPVDVWRITPDATGRLRISVKPLGPGPLGTIVVGDWNARETRGVGGPGALDTSRFGPIIVEQGKPIHVEVRAAGPDAGYLITSSLEPD